MSDRLQALQSAIGARYQLESEVSRGGMAAVYRARDKRHEREVAIKVLHPELATAVGAERFLQEIRLVAGLQHPHILPLYDSGETQDSLYYVMPFVDGESLRDRLTREKQLAVDVALRISGDVADALTFAHAHQIIHRDIKPENILLAGEHALVADFGVARAIHSALGERMTGTGLAVGTPAYMSPEQASGEHELDGRSDIYSLGCVLYEMLAGSPPFTGATPQAVISKRFTMSPADLRSLRPSVPAGVAELVKRALETVPADRFATAKEFSDTITRATTGENLRRSASDPVRGQSRRPWLIAAGVGLVAIVAAIIAGARAGLSRDTALDTSVYAIMPFAHRDGIPSTALDGENCARLLYEAFNRWNGISLVNDMQLHAERLRDNELDVDLDRALATARRHGAGRLVVGDVRPFGSAIKVRATLYDVTQRREIVQEYSVSIAPNASDAEAKFRELADSLLVGSTGVPSLRVGAGETRNFSALQSYVNGYKSLLDWDLDSAENSFRDATETDDNYALAHLWLAQVRSWRYPDKPAEWTSNAARAVALRSQLGSRDATLAEALLARSQRRYPEACQSYAALVARDSLDFVAWYGLAECHAGDDKLVPDPSSPSGWRFRTSYRTAIEAYRRALLIMPSFHHALRNVGFERLPQLLFTRPNLFRGGHVDGDTTPFGAFPSLIADTLAFVPWPRADLFTGRKGTRPATSVDANQRNRVLLQEITAKWIEEFPKSERAYEAHAFSLEEDGDLEGAAPGSGALATIIHARSLAADRSRSVDLGISQVRLLLKLERFAEARALGDSLLRSVGTVTPERAGRVAGLAALAGKAHLAASLYAGWAPLYVPRKPNGQAVSPAPPLPVRAHALRLYAYASLGWPADSLKTIQQRVFRLVESWAPRHERLAVQRALLDQTGRLAFPTIGLTPVHRAEAGGNYLMGMQWAASKHDTVRIRAKFEELQEYRKFDLPGDLKMEFTYHEALVYLAMQDTASAIARLDPSLNALPTLGRDMLDLATAASLVRAMALRADIAARQGDPAIARRWAKAAATLWAGADPELQPFVHRMQSMASGRN
ncbi:MAG: protein kinase [Gemmatimonadaceae bacterium]